MCGGAACRDARGVGRDKSRMHPCASFGACHSHPCCVQAVFDFVDVQSGVGGDIAPGTYHLATAFPRRVLEVRMPLLLRCWGLLCGACCSWAWLERLTAAAWPQQPSSTGWKPEPGVAGFGPLLPVCLHAGRCIQRRAAGQHPACAAC